MLSHLPKTDKMRVSENRGPQYSTLNSRILILRTEEVFDTSRMQGFTEKNQPREADSLPIPGPAVLWASASSSSFRGFWEWRV